MSHDRTEFSMPSKALKEACSKNGWTLQRIHGSWYAIRDTELSQVKLLLTTYRSYIDYCPRTSFSEYLRSNVRRRLNIKRFDIEMLEWSNEEIIAWCQAANRLNES